jgi:hypothetical protein
MSTADAARCFRSAIRGGPRPAFSLQNRCAGPPRMGSRVVSRASARTRPSLLPITRRDWVACRRQARGAGSVDPPPTVTIRLVDCRFASVRTSGLRRGFRIQERRLRTQRCRESSQGRSQPTKMRSTAALLNVATAASASSFAERGERPRRLARLLFPASTHGNRRRVTRPVTLTERGQTECAASSRWDSIHRLSTSPDSSDVISAYRGPGPGLCTT